MADFSRYYKRFFLHWGKELWSFGREQVVGVILAVLILFFQIEKGLIPAKDAALTAKATLLWPYLALIAIYLAIHLVRTPWKLDQKKITEITNLETERDKYLRSLTEIEKAKPNIVLRQPGAESVEQVTRAINGKPLTTVPFVKVRFVNQPTESYPGSIAHAVMARIRFYDLNNRLLLDMQGRWADSDQPSLRDFRQSRNDLLRMDFGIYDEHSLDIAFRDDTGEFVAWNNDNYNYPDMRKPEHVLTGDSFFVEIKLSAAWVDNTFKFQFGAAGDNRRGIVITEAPRTMSSAGVKT
jgi:hypothetical protein